MTLFVIPSLYYMVFGARERKKGKEVENIVQEYDAYENESMSL